MPIHYKDPTADVPPGVDFLVESEVRTWVAACEVNKPWRMPVRLRFAELIAYLPGSNVLELGSGPGLLAECVLQYCPNVSRYTLLDFSEHMLTLSREHLIRFSSAHFVKGDFKSEEWTSVLEPPYSAVIAMQAIHEIRHKRHVPALYRELRALLAPGGIISICDGTPKDSSLVQTSLYMTADEQVSALMNAGFSDVVVDKVFGSHVLITGRAN
jgi:ubiquinone/menaquinone biosynthesis C-methylase UbiE